MSKLSYLLLFPVLLFSCSSVKTSGERDAGNEFLKTKDIRIRDPFILADTVNKTYYLYASISNRTKKEGLGVEVYTSKDLQKWTKPKPVFKVPSDFWAKKWVWAPEVHKYKGKYYLFVTFTSNDLLKNRPAKVHSKFWPPYYKRGTQILVSESPTGPFKTFANKPATPVDEMCLDGTLWVEDGKPYIVYCHEWVQVQDGTIEYMPLKKDLSEADGESKIMFKASSAPWIKPVARGMAYVTDGCYLYRTKSGKLLMIWSSNGKSGYSVGIAISESDKLKGPWKQQNNLLFKNDGGHGMIFKTFEGQLVLALHQPNYSPNERLHLYKLKDMGNTLELEGELFK